jgi:hypothetical protein
MVIRNTHLNVISGEFHDLGDFRPGTVNIG